MTPFRTMATSAIALAAIAAFPAQAQDAPDAADSAGNGDEIIVTRMDHEGNVSPWLQLAEDLGLVVRFLPFDERSWQVEEDALKALLSGAMASGLSGCVIGLLPL